MRRFACASAVLASTAIYFSHVFRFHNDTALTSGLGDWVDPYFINFLLEHWHRSVWSLADPSSPPMYFPARGTLGYSHGLILYAPFYLAFRPFLDPFQAYTATVFLVLVTGSLCLYVVLRRFAGLRFIESLLLTAFFFSSRNVINGGTGVTWGFKTELKGAMERWFGLLFDRWIGADYEKGLAKLKALVEKEAAGG